MNKQIVEDVVDGFTAAETQSIYIQKLRQRVNRCVCRYCGSELILRRISYGNAEEGRLDLFCPSCDRIEYGVEPEIYKVAKYYIEEMGFDYFSDLDDSVRKDRMNQAKVCEMMQWCGKNLGLLDNQGFRTQVKLDALFSGKDLELSEAYLNEQPKR